MPAVDDQEVNRDADEDEHAGDVHDVHERQRVQVPQLRQREDHGTDGREEGHVALPADVRVVREEPVDVAGRRLDLTRQREKDRRVHEEHRGVHGDGRSGEIVHKVGDGDGSGKDVSAAPEQVRREEVERPEKHQDQHPEDPPVHSQHHRAVQNEPGADGVVDDVKGDLPPPGSLWGHLVGLSLVHGSVSRQRLELYLRGGRVRGVDPHGGELRLVGPPEALLEGAAARDGLEHPAEDAAVALGGLAHLQLALRRRDGLVVRPRDAPEGEVDHRRVTACRRGVRWEELDALLLHHRGVEAHARLALRSRAAVRVVQRDRPLGNP
mmetsp:Transcript_33496/g.72353  ORF Transcript_33496/g.72353 Transcript_33496/m.72353 type:complete len:324 (+) Transcript_33496:900-1871(+)